MMSKESRNLMTKDEIEERIRGLIILRNCDCYDPHIHLDLEKEREELEQLLKER